VSPTGIQPLDQVGSDRGCDCCEVPHVMRIAGLFCYLLERLAGPFLLASSTAGMASRIWEIHLSSLSATRRTHQARALLPLRATPASMSVSSVARSSKRRRVITGTFAAVNCVAVQPQATAQVTFRSYSDSARWAIVMR